MTATKNEHLNELDTTIAEWLGWTNVKVYPSASKPCGRMPGANGPPFDVSPVPQFSRNTEDMRAAELMLSPAQRVGYFDTLRRIVADDGGDRKFAEYAFGTLRVHGAISGAWVAMNDMMKANPEQRARAMIAVIKAPEMEVTP